MGKALFLNVICLCSEIIIQAFWIVMVAIDLDNRRFNAE